MAVPTKFTVEQLDLMEKAFMDGLCSTNMTLHAGRCECLSFETKIEIPKLKIWINNRKRKSGFVSSSDPSLSTSPGSTVARYEGSGKSLKRAPCNRRISAWNLFLSRTFKGDEPYLHRSVCLRKMAVSGSKDAKSTREDLHLHAKLAADVDLESMAQKDINKCISHSMQRVMKEDTKICRRPLTSSSPHLEQMKKVANFIASLKVIHADTDEDRTNDLKCLKGWCRTLQAIPELWSRINRDFDSTFFVTRQLNQDPLENFCGSIRQQGGNSDNLTPVQFKRAYRKLFHTNLPSVSSTNCEIDENVLLTQLTDIQNLPKMAPVEVGPLKKVTSDYSSEHIHKIIFKDNAMAYVAGYLLRKTFQKHKCQKCAILADESEDLEKKRSGRRFSLVYVDGRIGVLDLKTMSNGQRSASKDSLCYLILILRAPKESLAKNDKLISTDNTKWM
eukprot:gene5659-10894_t